MKLEDAFPMDDETKRRRAILMEERLGKERALLAGIRQHMTELRAMLERVSGHWGYEDGMYRFYHGSFKVYGLQEMTVAMVACLEKAAPAGKGLCEDFRAVVGLGTGKVFSYEVNKRWVEETLPMTTAFLHAKYFLEMAVRYGGLEEPPDSMPSGYAALLCLYGMR